MFWCMFVDVKFILIVTLNDRCVKRLLDGFWDENSIERQSKPFCDGCVRGLRYVAKSLCKLYFKNTSNSNFQRSDQVGCIRKEMGQKNIFLQSSCK